MTERLSVILYIAASLDGYIASAEGGVDWLSEFEADGEDHGYDNFFASVDGLVMGRTTYEQVLGFGEWVYGDKPCWVCTRRSLQPPKSSIIATSHTPTELVQDMLAQKMKRIWLVGGAKLTASFRNAGLISDYHLFWMPVLLGKGVPLFQNQSTPERLQLTQTHCFDNGVVQTIYRSQ